MSLIADAIRALRDRKQPETPTGPRVITFNLTNVDGEPLALFDGGPVDLATTSFIDAYTLASENYGRDGFAADGTRHPILGMAIIEVSS